MMINDKMPEYCVERASKILNRYKKSLNGSKVLVMGVAYKQDIDDYRESPAIPVIDILENNGAKVEFYDPYIKAFKYKGIIRHGLDFIDAKIIAGYDIIMITCAHSNVDYEMIQENAKVVFDTRNAMCNIDKRTNIEVL